MQLLTRLNPHQLRPLEDRHADSLIMQAVHEGAQAIIARAPRAWIDLNRDEREYDPDMIEGTPSDAVISAKVRGGLGLIPRRIARGGEIWRGRLTQAALSDRIARWHRPYHAELAAMLSETRAAFGVAVLVDVHSMPPVIDRYGEGAPQIVIGDRFGKSALGRFTARALSEAESLGLATAVNAPYAGGHILDRHADPWRGIHALQIEIDRRLYLDPALDLPGDGLPLVQRFVSAIFRALAEEALAPPFAIAAE